MFPFLINVSHAHRFQGILIQLLDLASQILTENIQFSAWQVEVQTYQLLE
jgi:hypothetical protein